MEKLILTDNTEISVINPLENSFQVETTPEKMVEIFNGLSVDNLKKIELQTEDGSVMAVFQNKAPKSCSYDAESEVATIYLVDVDLLAQQVKALQDTVDTLVMDELEA